MKRKNTKSARICATSHTWSLRRVAERPFPWCGKIAHLPCGPSCSSEGSLAWPHPSSQRGTGSESKTAKNAPKTVLHMIAYYISSLPRPGTQRNLSVWVMLIHTQAQKTITTLTHTTTPSQSVILPLRKQAVPQYSLDNTPNTQPKHTPSHMQSPSVHVVKQHVCTTGKFEVPSKHFQYFKGYKTYTAYFIADTVLKSFKVLREALKKSETVL